MSRRGAELHSVELRYTPTAFTPGEYTVDIGTAGSIALVVQTLLPCLLLGSGGDADSAASAVVISGGTNVSMAPQVDYLTRVFLPIASRMGVNMSLEVTKRGFFPRGNGRVRLTAAPVRSLTPIVMLERGAVVGVAVWAFHGGRMPAHVAAKMLTQAREVLQHGLVERGLGA
jgi:RNA 3'-terminal phosphate cyclase (ATP)